MNRGPAAPSDPVRVELDAPSGETWVWGTEESANSVTGSAYEFCKVVTRRTPVAESRLEIQGELAWQWMEIAQPWIEPPRISDQALMKSDSAGIYEQGCPNGAAIKAFH